MIKEQQELPEGWINERLCNLVDIVYGKTLPKKDLKESGYPVFGANGVIGHFDRYLYEDEQVLISSRGAYSGKANMSPPFSFITNNSLVLKPKLDNTILKKYLFYWLHVADKKSLVTGSAQPQVTINNANELLVPYSPLEQQKQIVAKIEELFSHIDAGIEGLKKSKALLKQYRQSVLKSAITGDLTKDWREQYANDIEPASQLRQRILIERQQRWEQQRLEQFQAKDKMPTNDKWKEKYKPLSQLEFKEIEALPGLPTSWIYSKLGNLIEEPKYGTSKKCSYDVSGIGVLRIPNVANGYIDALDLKFAEFDTSEIDTYRLIEDDVLIIRSNGSVNLVGKCALVRSYDTDFLYAGYLIRLRPNPNILAGSYLISCMNSILLRNQIESKAKSTSGVNNINAKELQDLIVPMCSLEEQKEIVQRVEEKLTAADRLMAELDTKLIQAQQQKKTILASAFKGELVEPIFFKEDANTLLERIKKSKESSHTEFKPKRTVKKKSRGVFMKRPIIEVLKERGELKVPVLMQEAGFDQDEVEEFYDALSDVSDQINEIRPPKEQQIYWPYDGEIIVKLI